MATIDDARQLSSGTIATLILRSDYAAIERVQTAFVAFIARMDDAARGYGQRQCYETWQDAWKTFTGTKDFETAVIGS